MRVFDRKTNKLIQEEVRRTFNAADRLWCIALKNVNPLKYKLKFVEIKDSD